MKFKVGKQKRKFKVGTRVQWHNVDQKVFGTVLSIEWKDDYDQYFYMVQFDNIAKFKPSIEVQIKNKTTGLPLRGSEIIRVKE